MQYLLGYDIGSSSIKVALLEIETGKTLASATSPSQEMTMIAIKTGWAEQNPSDWWQEAINATQLLKQKFKFDPSEVAAIGVSYQMHGLVVVDKNQEVLRPSIIWCDSRAVKIGDKAFKTLGQDHCLETLLNSPGNFTASKLRWIKENEPNLFDKIHKVMLPGDYIAMRMTGKANTTISGLSEGIFWDFQKNKPSEELLQYYGIPESLISDLVPTFGAQGQLTKNAAVQLGLSPGIPITYRAGDQPNNAFSLNVLNPGEVAATAGTSGVVYGVNQKATSDPASRVNSFVHVNSTTETPRNGVLLCVNGTGALNSWLRRNTGDLAYESMNALAAQAPIGSDGLSFIPFGNGAERILKNKDMGASLRGLQFNRHGQAHLCRAAQEGIVFALQYGLQIMNEMGVETKTVRAGHANMFLSPIFREAFANTTGATVELYNTDGATGAARGAGVGVGVYPDFPSAFKGLEKISEVEPEKYLEEQYRAAYHKWKIFLNKI